MKVFKFLIVVYFIFLGIIILNSCSESSSNPPLSERGKVINFGQSTKIDTNWFLNEISTIDHSDPHFLSYKDVIDSIRAKKAQLFVPMFAQFDYKSVNNQKNIANLSGLIIFPFSVNKQEVSNLPVICLTHATEIMRKHAPSSFNLSFDDFPEVAIGIIIAATGYVVVMPDYQGMGKDDGEFHPFCNAELLGMASADMISAVRDFVAKYECPFGLSKQNFFMGYSEGGFVTLAATREFEKTYPNFTLSGSVPMSGPYDLTGTMAGVMLADTAFPQPYFLPYVIRGYQEIYPAYFPWDSVLNSGYLNSIPPLMDGFHNADAINSVMPKDKVLKKIFNDSFIAKLQDKNSDVFKKLYENNLGQGWAPKTLVHFLHCKLDDCVPYNNTVVAYNYFHDVLNLSNVTKEEPELYLPIGQTTHVNACPGCFLYGFMWIAEHSD